MDFKAEQNVFELEPHEPLVYRLPEDKLEYTQAEAPGLIQHLIIGRDALVDEQPSTMSGDLAARRVAETARYRKLRQYDKALKVLSEHVDLGMPDFEQLLPHEL